MKKHFIALCGGVGGSKLADGLARHLAPHELTLVVNTGDDFEHLGLRICPDIDTVLYMLAGLVSRERGWGREDESWTTHRTMQSLGAPSWFQLGDKDIALHLYRNALLASGCNLSQATAQIAWGLDIPHIPVPVTDEATPTTIVTDEGDLSFQEYFVKRRADVGVTGIRYGGRRETKLSDGLEAALANPDLAGIIIAPSNPFLSIEPMLAAGGLRERIAALNVPITVVSPYVNGAAVKGPIERIQHDLGLPPGDAGVLRHYDGLIDMFFSDHSEIAVPAGVSLVEGNTLMLDAADRADLAFRILSQLRWQK
jgi:LPPG:FO 2-phospho-L-lactate transferase